MLVPRHVIPHHFVLALLVFFGIGSHSVSAAECFPHCDYSHYYGPFDFTYIAPGLFGYPLCDARGNCSPQLAYSPVRRGRITVRFPRVAAPPPRP